MSLPVGLGGLVDTDELKPPQGRNTQGPTGSREFTTLMNQINGEGKSERVDLSIGGYVTISLSPYNWTLYDCEYQHDPTIEENIARAEFVDAGGHSEAVLLIDIESGEVVSVQVNRRGEHMVGTYSGP